MQVELLREAKIEVRKAAFWPGTTGEAPPIRRLKVDRFPYAIAFEVHQAFVLVLAVAHSRQRPLYWLSRTSPGR